LNTVTDHIQRVVFPALAQSLNNDSAAVDCASLKKCTDAITAAACVDWPLGGPLHLPVNEPACLTIITPKIAATSACTQNYQCIGGFCAAGAGGAGGGGNATTCHAFVGLNDTCDPTNTDPDLRCQTTGQFCSTSSTKCMVKFDDGVTCANNDECKSGNCDMGPHKCADPTVCSYDPAPSNCSLAPGRAGAPLGVVGLLLGLGVAIGLRRRR
jgi:hypothetical protein